MLWFIVIIYFNRKCFTFLSSYFTCLLYFVAAVTEVVWEGDEAETKSDSNTTKKVDNIATSNTANR